MASLFRFALRSSLLGLVAGLAELCERQSCDDSDSLELFQRVSKEASRSLSRAPAPEPEPNFGPNVIVVEPDLNASQRAELEVMFQGFYDDWISWDYESQFGTHRTAVFLLPGTHKLDIELPYYFGVYGLGALPSDTIAGPGSSGKGLAVSRQPGGLPNTNTFWRTIENVHVPQKLNFFVSQAAPLRKVIVDGDLQLAEGGTDWTSGGALANSEIQGNIYPITQQQWYTRGTKMQPYSHPAGLGSYVAVGCVNQDGAFAPSWDFRSGHNKPRQSGHTGVTYTEAPEVFAEKPFIMMEEGKYKLRIPEVLYGHSGPDWQTGSTVGFEQVFVTQQSTTAQEINTKIAEGKHIVLTPAVYYLDEPIVVNHPNIVILGLGFATLVPKQVPAFVGRGVIEVGPVDGVRLAAVFVQAGPQASPDYSTAVKALIRWGDAKTPYVGSRSNPGFMYDVIARVGGPDNSSVGVDTMLEVNNGWVITDNTWLWKADHCSFSSGALCIPQRYVNHCLVVNGENVHMYGLMAEHANEDIVVWNGEHGKTYFFQSEMKYTLGPLSDPSGWQRVTHAVSYRVNAVNHIAVGVGIYCVVLAEDVDDDTMPMANVAEPGGMSAIAVRNADAYLWGFKDVAALNWNMQWPLESRLTCKAWCDATSQCLDTGVSPPR